MRLIKECGFSATLFLTLVGVFSVIQSASATVIQTGRVIATDFGDNSPEFDIGNTFDQSGLEQPYQSGVTNFDAYVANTGSLGAFGGNSWFSENSPVLPGDIVFDLGSPLSVAKLAIWSFNTSDGNVLDQFEVRVSDDPTFATSTLVGSFTFITNLGGPAVDPRPAQVFEFNKPTVGRFVQLTLTAANSTLVGAGEFAFGVTVPEAAIQTGTVISTDFGELTPGFDIGNTFDQSGLEQPYQSGLTDFDAYVANTGSLTGTDDNSWISESPATLPGDIVFDLGSSLSVAKLAIWSFEENDFSALDQFEVRVSDDPTFATSTLVGSFTFINFLGGQSVSPRPAQVFEFNKATVGRFVQLTLTAASSSLVGAGEFAFGVRSGADESFYVIPIVGPNGTKVVVVPL